MNKKAEELSLTNTTFSNPHGLQNAMNTSCPKDLITLCVYACKNQKFREIMNSNYFRYYSWEEKKDVASLTKSTTFESMDKNKEEEVVTIQQKLATNSPYTRCVRRSWWNTNMLLKKGWEGVKTGHTAAAGSCLASLKKGIFIVVLNCKDN